MKRVLIGILLLFSEIIMAQKPQIMIQRGHLSNIMNFTISPDENYLLSIDGDFKGILWDIKKGRQLLILNDLGAASFTNDSRSILIVKKDKSVSKIDLMGKSLSVAYPDIKSLWPHGWIENDHKKMRIDNTLIDLTTGDRTNFKTTEYYKKAAFSPNTNSFCVGTKGFIHFFKATDATPTGIINIPDMDGDKMTNVDFSPDGAFLLVSDPTQCQL
jgi:WD40 repeat protein